MDRSLRLHRRTRVVGIVLAVAAMLTLAFAVGFAKADPSGNAGYKIQMCHDGHTISVDFAAVQSHVDHGDTPGPCP